MSEDDLIATDRGTPPADEPSPARLIVTLAVAGLISGIAIVGVFQATFATIASNRERELKEAVFTVLPGVTRMQEMIYSDERLVPGESKEEGQAIYAGFDENRNFVGYAIPADGPGFQDTIALLYGYQPKTKQIVGMQVLESRETPGLGDKIYKDAKFVAQFSDLSVEPVVELIRGKGNKPNQVDAITGATISSRAVVRIINETNDSWLSKLPANEPTLAADSEN